MLKWLVFAVAVVAAIWLLRRALSTRDGVRPRAPREREQSALVLCAHCSVHLPRGEALEAAGNFYCSEEHRRLGPLR